MEFHVSNSHQIVKIDQRIMLNSLFLDAPPGVLIVNPFYPHSNTSYSLSSVKTLIMAFTHAYDTQIYFPLSTLDTGRSFNPPRESRSRCCQTEFLIIDTQKPNDTFQRVFQQQSLHKMFLPPFPTFSHLFPPFRRFLGRVGVSIRID